jgi:PAS domain S-box-containing protein
MDDLRRRQRHEWLGLVLLLFLAGLAAIGAGWREHREIDRAERARLGVQASAAQQILARPLESAYASLAALREDIANVADEALPLRVVPRLSALAEAIPGLAMLALVDDQGRVRASSRPTLADASLGERLPSLRDPGTLYVTPPFRDTTGGLAIDLMLPVASDRGGGMLVATLDAEYFNVVLRSVLYAPDMRGWVMHGGGGVLLVEPPVPLAEGWSLAVPGSMFNRHVDSGQADSLFSGVVPTDGSRRLVALRTLRPGRVPMDTPLVLAVSRDLGAVFAPWRAQVLTHSVLFGAVTLVLVFALWQLQRRQRELQALQRDAAERERADSERLALALRGADLGLWDLDLRTQRGTTNERWSSMLGYEPGELRTDKDAWLALVHPDDREPVAQAQQAHIDGHSESFEAIYRLRHRDGRWLWILDRGKVLARDPAGVPLRMLGTHMDISQLMEAEQALRRSEQSLAITLHSIGDGVIATDEQGRITRVNAAAARLTGWPENEARGQPLAAVFRIADPRTGAAVADPVQAVLARGEVVGLADDTQLLARDGRSVPIADSAAPIRTADGAVAGVVVVFSDVSERHRAEQALRERERQLSTLADALPGPVSRVDTDGRYLFANAAYQTWFGLAPEQVIGRTQREVLGERRYAAVEPYIARAHGGETVRYEHPVHAADGTRRWALFTLLPVRDEQGRQSGHFTIAVDITDRKRAEDALRESERKTRALVENLMVGVVVHDPETHVLDANPAACRLLGLTLEQLSGRTAIDPEWRFLEEDGTPMAPSRYPVSQVVATGQPLSNLVGGLLLPGAERPRWVLVNAFPTRRADGAIDNILVTFLDITERREAEVERLALEGQLRESQKMESIGTLAGGIAHDFNNILAAILGNVALAREGAGAAHPVQASLEQIQKAGLRARSLVQQILAFSRREPGALQVQPLRTVVEETLALLRATLPAQVRLDAQLPDEPVPVSADATQLQQVLMNLATNAWHALPERGGHIEIGIERIGAGAAALRADTALPPGPLAHLWVRDNGCGMDAATRARIFDPFFTTKPVGQGTGLGLSVVHGIVRVHRGHIELESAPGVGTTFHLYFASPNGAAAAGPDEAVAGRGVGGGGRHVLYVDDDEVMRTLAERLLQRAGYRVSTCASGTEALRVLRAAPQDFDIVVSDVNMPEMSGVDLAQQLALLRADLPVMLSSGLVSEELRSQARQVGVRALIRKEFSFEELAATVEKVLAGS